MSSKIVFYAEGFTLQLLLTIIFKKKPEIIILKDSVDFYNDNTNEVSLFEKIITSLFPKIKIKREPDYPHRKKELSDDGVCYIANKKLLDFTESKFFLNKLNKIIYPLEKTIIDKNVIIAVKKQLLALIYQKIIFYLILKEIENEFTIDQVFLSSPDIFEIANYLNVEETIEQKTIRSNSFVNLVKSIFYLFSPYLIKLIAKRRINLFRPNRKSYDLGIQIVWGLPPKTPGMNKESFDNIVTDDELIKDIDIDKSKVIFLEGKKFGRKLDYYERSKQKKYIDQIGCSIVDDSKLGITLKILFSNIIYSSFKNFFIFKIFSNSYVGDFNTDKVIQKIYCEYIEHKIIAEYFDIKIFVSRDDYDSSHITRTIVQNYYKNINVGIQHSAYSYPYILPLQAYNYFDRYYTQGVEFQNLWSPYWNSNKLNIPAGTQRAHLVDPSRVNNIKKDYYDRKYCGKINILLLISSVNSIHTPKWLYKKKYSRLEEIIELHSDINLILKTRFKNDAYDLLSFNPKLKKYLNKKLFIENENLTTQELISQVNIFIAEDNSSAILEAIHLKELLTLGYRIRYPHQNNLNKIIMKNFDDLKLSISSFIHKKEFPLNYEKYRDEMANNFSMDANTSNWERIRNDFKKYLNQS